MRIKAGLDFPVPWFAQRAAMLAGKFSGDFFSYGIEANRPPLSLFMRYAYEQGVAHQLAATVDLFPKGIVIAVRI